MIRKLNVIVCAIACLSFSTVNVALATPQHTSKNNSTQIKLAQEEETTASEEKSEENGQFIFEVKKVDEYADLYKILEEDTGFTETIKNLNDFLELPHDLHIYFDKTEGGSSYYSPSKKEIHLSYYRFNQIMNLYKKANPDESEEAVHEYGLNVMQFIFYHELGHALIDIYKLPIVGDEETSADNLAAVISLELMPKGWDITTGAADFFDLLREEYKDEEQESSMWDEHRMDAQRYYYILCLTYGKYPEQTEKELKSYDDSDLSKFVEERGERCKYDYQDSLAKWTQALEPHFKMSIEEIKAQVAKES